MDWLLAAPQIHSAFSSLGSLEGDSYIVSPNALAILEEINYKLTYEDQTLRTFRRAIGFGQNVRTDLIPLLENAKDEAVLDAVIRILVNLTVPVECLFSVDIMYRTEVGRHTIFELNKLLYMSKEAFTDSKSTKSVVEYMKDILESDTKLSLQKCDQINNCLLLLRNILHIPETSANFIVPANANNGHTVSMQNSILWNLFIQSIDKLLLYLMTCPQRDFWGVTMVQLIALMYKDQHVSTLQKLLNSWFETSLSESSEDNESNTSPLKQGSGDSSPMLTSDPTSDSSDNGSNCKNESSEDRRQALREETEATLQEVSRKGQEYQEFQEYKNSIMRVPTPQNSSGSSTAPDDFEQPCLSATETYKSNQLIKKETECINMDFSVMNPIGIMPTTPVHEKSQKRKFKQSANNNSHTTKQKLSNNHENSTNDFMPPPAVPVVKTTAMEHITDVQPVLSDSSPLPHQKVKHAGQLKLTKGKSCPQKRECPSSQSELSDCGYGTQVENQESISTSSNDDDAPQGKPQHQKPPCNSKPRNKHRVIPTMIDRKELRRKKLVRRSKSSLINMKGLVQHTPTDEDISNILKEFTVDFLLKGYGLLVEELHKQLLTDLKIPIDTSHFFWLVTYFLKFAAQMELDLEHINTILTYDIISFLTYEGVTLCEQLDLNSRQKSSDLKPILRRMHLVVTAIREFLQAIETYKKVTHLSEDDHEHLHRLEVQISTTEDLRCLFVLLLRRFNPSLHTKQYLQDLIVTNHILLVILDGVTKTDESVNIKMIDHISQFANMEIMHHYGILLEDFDNNGEFVNDCIFTMMHHVGGDLGRISTLFQPVILKTYSRIWEADYQLCDDWSDLIEHVIHKFMNTPQKNTLALPSTSLTALTKEHNMETAVCTWSQEEMDTLYWYYVQSKKDNDLIGKILSLFTNNGNKQKSRISIINQLLQQDIITLVEYDDLMKFEDIEYQRTLLTTPTSCTTESGVEIKSSGPLDKPSDDIQFLLGFILKENKENLLIWLQKFLLECCYIKIVMRKSQLRQDHQELDYVMEPVAYHAILKRKSIPVVQWSNDHAAAMLYQPFVLLLHKLGFQLPADAGSIFARIPDYWTPESMFALVKKLGSYNKLLIKFSLNDLEEDAPSCYHITAARASLSSMSSFEADMTESDHVPTCSSNSGLLSPVPEIEIKAEKSHEIFAIPKAKHCHSIIRFTPDPSPMPPIPNWLQVVMRSKCNSAINQQLGTIITPQIATTSTMLATSQRIETNVSLLHSSHTSNDPTTLTSTSTATLTETTAMLQHSTTVTSASIAVSTTLTTTVETAAASKITKQFEQQQQATTTKAMGTLLCSNIIGLNDEQQQQQQKHSKQATSHNNSFMNIGSKTSANELNENKASQPTSLSSKTSSTMLVAPAAIPTTALEFHQLKHQNVNDDDAAMKSLERNDSTSSSLLTRSGYSENLENEYSAMVASVYENDIANSDTASVTSDLTRMYVSDEEERQEFSVSNFL